MSGEGLKVGVLGASGFLGNQVVRALLDEGVTPRAVLRRATSMNLRGLDVPTLRADLDDDDGLAAALSGLDMVVHAAAYYPKLSVDHAAVVRTGVAQTERILDAAASAGVRRFVYLGSTATVAPAEGRPSDERDIYATSPGHGPYHDAKWAMEQRVLAEDRFETRVCLPSACLGPGDLRVGTSGMLVATARGLDPAHPEGVVSWVDVRDVGRGAARQLLRDGAPRRIVLSAGSQSLHDMLVALADRYRVAPPSPALAPAVAIRLADEAEHAAAASGQRPSISREIVDLVVRGVPMDASLAQRTLDLTWRPLPDTLDAFDAWARKLKLIPPLPQS